MSSCGLTAAVELVEPLNVFTAHLLSVSKGDVGIGDGDHGGLVVLGESVPKAEHRPVRSMHPQHTQKKMKRGQVSSPVVLHDRVVIVGSALVEGGNFPEVVLHS